MLRIFKINNKLMMITSTMLTTRTDGGAIANVKDIEAVESDPRKGNALLSVPLTPSEPAP